MHLSLGALIGLTIAAILTATLLAAAGAAGAALVVSKRRRESSYGDLWADYFLAALWLIGALVVAGVVAVSFTRA